MSLLLRRPPGVRPTRRFFYCHQAACSKEPRKLLDAMQGSRPPPSLENPGADRSPNPHQRDSITDGQIFLTSHPVQLATASIM